MRTVPYLFYHSEIITQAPSLWIKIPNFGVIPVGQHPAHNVLRQGVRGLGFRGSGVEGSGV